MLERPQPDNGAGRAPAPAPQQQRSARQTNGTNSASINDTNSSGTDNSASNNSAGNNDNGADDDNGAGSERDRHRAAVASGQARTPAPASERPAGACPDGAEPGVEPAGQADPQQQQSHVIRNKLKNIVIALLAKKKETKMDNLEAMINESALKLLQQKELVFKQASCLQLDQLCRTTKFSRRELKWLYSGWKVACTDGCGASPDSLGGSDNSYGIINEQQFQQIYAQFFPYGGDCSFYAKYVFQAMFSETLIKNGGFITFADYAHALSKLLRGTIDDKIDFVFRLYDLNNDNVITIDELSRIFFAVYRLLGDNVNQKHDQMTYEQQAERLYKRIDQDQSGSITREQFMDYCKRDSTIVDTIQMLEMSICSIA